MGSDRRRMSDVHALGIRGHGRNLAPAAHNMVFTQGPSAHLSSLPTLAGLGTIFSNSGIVRFVQGGVVKTFRYVPQPIVIRAVVNSLEPNDHDGWSAFAAHESADPYDDYGWFHVTVGATDTDGGNDFQLCVSTPRAVSRAKSDGRTPGILVDRFDAKSVHDAVHNRIQSIEAHSWDQIVDECRTFMHWEYEGMAGT